MVAIVTAMTAPATARHADAATAAREGVARYPVRAENIWDLEASELAACSMCACVLQGRRIDKQVGPTQ
jgi:hypothetical protein